MFSLLLLSFYLPAALPVILRMFACMIAHIIARMARQVMNAAATFSYNKARMQLTMVKITPMTDIIILKAGLIITAQRQAM